MPISSDKVTPTKFFDNFIKIEVFRDKVKKNKFIRL